MRLWNELRNAIARGMYGRNGLDQLNIALLCAEAAVYVLSALLRLHLLRAVGFVFFAAFCYRALSRDLVRRRAENAKFLYWFGPRSAALRDWQYRRRDKAHKYVKCVCGAWCRVPRGVGRVELLCPRCGEKKIIQT